MRIEPYYIFPKTEMNIVEIRLVVNLYCCSWQMADINEPVPI